ncbi:MAG: hypothetical protein RIQ34_1261, partial [Bacteroidota bacterium]
YPPNVAGWPGGKTWIDSSSLMLRMRVPRLLLGEDEWNIGGKTDDDVQMGMMQRLQNRLEAKVDWMPLLSSFKKVPLEKLPAQLSDLLLQTQRAQTIALLKSYVVAADRDASIRQLTAHILSTPEYQLC